MLDPSGAVKPRPVRNAGVTLLELLVAISLSALVVGMAMALYKDAGRASRMSQGRRDAAFRAQTLFASLSANLMTGGGILRIGPGRLDLLNARNRRVEYRWEDSTLTANGKPWDFKVVSMDAVPSGPDRPDLGRGLYGEEPWALDSLDGNRDGELDFAELDRDRDGELGPEECRYIARVRLTLTIMHQGLPSTLACTIHPRNRVRAAQGQDAEAVMEAEGIPEP